MRRSLGRYSLQNSERWWSFGKWADSTIDTSAGQPNLLQFVFFYTGT